MKGRRRTDETREEQIRMGEDPNECMTLIEMQIVMDAVAAMPPAINSETAKRRVKLKRKLRLIFEELEDTVIIENMVETGTRRVN